jgi:hypothetical protein
VICLARQLILGAFEALCCLSRCYIIWEPLNGRCDIIWEPLNGIRYWRVCWNFATVHRLQFRDMQWICILVGGGYSRSTVFWDVTSFSWYRLHGITILKTIVIFIAVTVRISNLRKYVASFKIARFQKNLLFFVLCFYTKETLFLLVAHCVWEACVFYTVL